MVTTYDNMTGVSQDKFFTFDDPLRNSWIDKTYATKSVTRDAPGVMVDWAGAGDGVRNGLDAPFGRDEFDRVTASNWDTSTFGQVWTPNVPAQFSADGTFGNIDLEVLNASRHAVMNISSIDFDEAILCQAPTYTTSSVLGLGAVMIYGYARYTDTANHIRMGILFQPTGAMRWIIELVSGGSVSTLGSGGVSSTQWDPNAWYWLRIQGQGTSIRGKVWKDGDAVPDIWDLYATDTTFNNVAGRIGVGGALMSTVTNTLPYRIRFYRIISGIHRVMANSTVTVNNSYNDGMPSGVSNSSGNGVPDGSASITSPPGTRHAVYFSQYRKDQEFWDVDRDTPGVGITSSMVTQDGIKAVRMFTGQSQDMQVQADDVSMPVISRNRLRLSAAIQPPPVHGFFEGCEATWVVGYACWAAGLLNTPPLLPGTRFYAPLNGSLHPYLHGTMGAFPIRYGQYTAPASFAFIRPSFIDGPFPGTAAPSVSINAQRTAFIQNNTPFPFVPGADMWSQQGSRGRIEFWIKGDPTDVAASYDTAPTNASLMQMIFKTSDSTTRFIRFAVSTDERRLYAFMRDGVTSVLFRHPIPVPADGAWHFCAMSWDGPADQLRMTMDDNLATWTMGFNNAVLPYVDDITTHEFNSYLPMAEIKIVTGPSAPLFYAPWTKDIRWTRTANLRRSTLNLDGVAETGTREAFELISSYAQAELAITGFDNNDVFQYQTVRALADPKPNAVMDSLSTRDTLGTDFKPIWDLTRIYNQVTVQYKASAIQEYWANAYQAGNGQMLLPIGFSTITIPLSGAAIELRGFTFSILDGTALTASPPSDTNAINYISANTTSDGTGSYANSANLTVTVIRWNPGSVTVLVNNASGVPLYVTNNVNIAPFGIAAKLLVSQDATVYAEDKASISKRGARSINVNLGAIQYQNDAQVVANELVARASRPRLRFTSSVFGDPRRVPLQVVSVDDSDQTGLSGLFRIINVQSTQEKENLRQSIAADRALPVLVWGQGNWGESVWGP